MKKRKLLRKLANHLQVGGRFNDPSFTKANNLSESEYKRLCGMVGLILEYYL
ncbi:MAG: hypothetical protein ACI9EV_001560, partial [Urechidicola sp.]